MSLPLAAARLAVLTLAAAALAGATPAQAQGEAGRPPTVRLQLRNLDLVHGYLRGHSADEVVIYTREGRFRHVPLSDVQRFEVRTRTGSHTARGALIGVLAWGSIMAAAALGSLDDAGVASWQSGTILAATTGIGTLIGSRIPRYGWRETEPRMVPRAAAGPALTFTIRF